MTRDVATVTPQTTLKDVATLLVERRISGVPVVAADGSVVGIVSETDILYKEEGDPRSRLERLLGPLSEPDRAKRVALTAGQAMTKPVVTIGAHAFVAEAARIMLDNGVKRLPVLENGVLAGIVSRSDLVRAFARDDDEIEREIRDDVLIRSHWISPATLDVHVHDGRVVLMGAVETRQLAESVRYFVERVPGVVSVDSRIRVATPVA